MNLHTNSYRSMGGKAATSLVALWAALWLVLAAHPASAGECAVSGVVTRTVASLQVASQRGTASAYTAVLARHANIPGVALFALGPYRNSVSAREQVEYVRLAGAYMGQMLADYGGRIVHGTLVIGNCLDLNGATLVKSRFGSSQVTWWVKGQRIGDVNVEGIWLAAQLHSTFVAVLRRGGGDIDALLHYLR